MHLQCDNLNRVAFQDRKYGYIHNHINNEPKTVETLQRYAEYKKQITIIKKNKE